MRRPIALLAAVVTGMALLAAGLVGSHYGFRDWPMAPAPESAQHVTVEHDTLAGGPGKSTRSSTSPLAPARHGVADSATAAGRAGAEALAPRKAFVNRHAEHSGNRSGGRRSGGNSGSGHHQQHGGGGNSGSPTDTPGTGGGGSSSGPAAPTPTTPVIPPAPATGPSTSSEVTPAAADPTPAAPAPAPAEPQPTTPAPPTPDPTPPAPTNPTPPSGGSGSSHPRGPLGQLLHDLLGLRKIQS
jgi:hypothetical protein